MRALACVLAASLTCLFVPAAALAAGNASSAAGFVEAAQNKDGGFGSKKGKASNLDASLWATAALLAAGKNPRDEFLKNGRSADQYLVAHLGECRSLSRLGLLAIIQGSSGLGANRYGNPAAKLRTLLSAGRVRADPHGAALAVLGLLTVGDAQARQTAGSMAQALLASRTSDGAWGPAGNADSASTALVLLALARTGATKAGDPAATSGLTYLKAAQANDGSIAVSTRVDKATAGGAVPATAFTLQALAALGAPSPTTAEGKTVRQGLTQYQQQGSGGLTSKGSAYSQVPPSVVETAQAFGAFDGTTYPLRAVAAKTQGPDRAKNKGAEKSKKAGEGRDPNSNRVSDGTSADGVSGSTGVNNQKDPGAFRGAKAGSRGNTAGRAASRKRDRAGKQKPGAKARSATGGGGGTDVEGTVVGAHGAPGLKTKAGALDDGLTREQQATIVLSVFLALALLAGVYLERLAPRATGAPPLIFAGGAAIRQRLGPLGTAVHRAAGFAARDGATGAVLTSRRRWPLVAAAALGIALIAFPVATKMFERGPKGAAMIQHFAPYMHASRLDGFDRDLGDIRGYAREVNTTLPALLDGPSATRDDIASKTPQAALFAQQWPSGDRKMRGLLGTIRAHRTEYDAVAALPSFSLFPWFFVAPGVLLIGFAALGLLLGRRRAALWIPLRRALIVVGVALLVAPFAFQLFTRAPQGARMVDGFETVETRANVQGIQGQFGTAAVGHGSIDSEVRPALQRTGLNGQQIRQRLPAAARLDQRWVSVLNGLTPMIGVMSDNVANYRAVAALPRFTVFPWIFVAAGLAALALCLLAGRRPVTDHPRDPKENPNDPEHDAPVRDDRGPRSRLGGSRPRPRRAGGQAERHVQDRSG